MTRPGIEPATSRSQSGHLTMSLILMPNKVGDKMLPCGTPCSYSNMSDNVLPFRTLNVQSDKKKNLTKRGNRPKDLIYVNLSWCHIVVSGFFKVKKYSYDMFVFNSHHE